MTDTLRWQFDLVWALAELHLDALVDDDFPWAPAASVWTVRAGDDGRWRPDWADTEPDPIPVPTIGWLSWHIDWWWTVTLAHLSGEVPPDRTDVFWPGSGPAAVARLRELADRWRELLAGLDAEALQQPSSFPWGSDAGRTAAHTVLWVNVELTKNVSEIGQLRLLRAAATSAA